MKKWAAAKVLTSRFSSCHRSPHFPHQRGKSGFEKKKGVGEVATATTTATLSAAIGTWGPDAVKCNDAVPESDFSKVV